MPKRLKPYAVRLRDGQREVVFIEHVRDGFWRGWRIPDGVWTRGPVHALLERFTTLEGAEMFRDGKEEVDGLE